MLNSDEIENLFSDEALVALVEYGLTFLIAKKLEGILNADGLLDKALLNLLRLTLDDLPLTTFEKTFLEYVKQSI